MQKVIDDTGGSPRCIFSSSYSPRSLNLFRRTPSCGSAADSPILIPHIPAPDGKNKATDALQCVFQLSAEAASQNVVFRLRGDTSSCEAETGLVSNRVRGIFQLGVQR